MDALANVLADPARSGIYHLTREPHEIEKSAAAAGLAAWRIDIGHIHGRQDFLQKLAVALEFPERSGEGWNALTDLSWRPGAGWVLVLEKSKHFAAGHRHEFDDAMAVLADAASYWRGKGKAFWVLVGGAEGWSSGFPPLPQR
ncbi:MAG: barstar family protein [Burkholderiales bacterium]